MNRCEMNDSPGPGPGRRWARLRRAGLAAVLALIAARVVPSIRPAADQHISPH